MLPADNRVPPGYIPPYAAKPEEPQRWSPQQVTTPTSRHGPVYAAPQGDPRLQRYGDPGYQAYAGPGQINQPPQYEKFQTVKTKTLERVDSDSILSESQIYFYKTEN
jgi:hypothetical protein